MPNLRTCIIWSSSLSLSHSIVTDFRNVHISQFENGMFLVNEDICRFYVSMENFDFMKALKTFKTLDGNVPDSCLFYWFFNTLVLLDVLTQISSLKEFRNETEWAWYFVIKWIHKCKYIRIINTCQDSNLIETVSDLLFWKRLDFDSFKCIEFRIGFSLDFVDRGKGSLSKFRDDFVLVHW